jgi:hypothetical protein
MADSFAEVVIMGTALHKGLHYLVPPRFAGKVQPGSRVSVELGKRKATGVVVWVGDSPPDLPETITLRPILDTIDELPAIPPDLLQLCLWISSYYFYPLGEVFDLVIPFKGSEPIGSDLKSSKRKSARLIDRAASDSTGGQGGPSLRCGSPLHAGVSGNASSPRPIFSEGGPSLRCGSPLHAGVSGNASSPRPIFSEGGPST